MDSIEQAMKETMRKFYVLDKDEIMDYVYEAEMSRNSAIRLLIHVISKRMRNSFLDNIYGVNNHEVEDLIKELEEETYKVYSRDD